MKNLRVSFSFRAFIIYFVILGSLSWYIVNNAIERLNDGMRQSAESVMVDMSHLLASELERQLGNSETIDITALDALFSNILDRDISAKIYQITKNSIETDIYITDAQGVVLYDSSGKNTGKDFSEWRDVRLTLAGEYGARTSFLDPNKTADEDEKVMVVAAPIYSRSNDIIGVLSVVKSISSLEGHLQTESTQLKNFAFLLVALAIFIGYLFSIWLTKSLEKIAHYAQTLAQGRTTKQPRFWDDRLNKLSSSVNTLRNQLDGKEYVEEYIHSLTHELKTPITSIRGAAELLQEDMPLQDRKKFIRNIHSSNNRMAQLVDKMLSLAKLESNTAPLEYEDFDIVQTIDRLLEERQAYIHKKQLTILPTQNSYFVHADRVLLRQAIANLLDNAIAFCPPAGTITIDFLESITTHSSQYKVQVFNQGQHIPDYALARLYERFFSMPADNPIGTTAKSTGLGLSFVKEIMKHHHGTVQIINKTEASLGDGVQASLSWPKVAN